MTIPKLAGTAAQVMVKDSVRIADYYQKILGFELVGFFPDKNSCAYVMLQRDSYQIHLGGTDNDVMHYNCCLRPGTPDFLIWLPEIEIYYQEIKAK